MEIFHFGALTILHCYILDEDFGGHEHTPKALLEYMEDMRSMDNKIDSVTDLNNQQVNFEGGDMVAVKKKTPSKKNKCVPV